jgi:hypothetical protein
MRHTSSEEDLAFQASFESCEFPPGEFDHKSHVRLAYVYLCSHGTDSAQKLMQSSLLRFLKHNGVDPVKYHETLTRAWLLAIRYFMEQAPASDSAESFMLSDLRMLDPDIMLTHYSASHLFSEEARQRFVEPNLSPIPRFGD